MWEELGISAGTAVVCLIVLYFIIKNAVKNGVHQALLMREKEKETEKDK